MKFTHLHCHSHLSLLDGLSKPKEIAKRCSELGYTACALTDHGTLGGAVDFIKECKEFNIKPIIGCECYIVEDTHIHDNKINPVGHQIILAKNFNGWKKLVQLTSASNNEGNFYYKPRIDINMLKTFCTGDDLISFSGHPGSTLDRIFRSEEHATQYIHQMQDIFGKENFFIEIQLIDVENVTGSITLAKKLREIANKLKIKCIATGDSHYTYKTDAQDHHVLLCSALKTTLSKAKNGHSGLDTFFRSENFSIPKIEELSYNTNEEIENTFIIEEMCESYDIASKPKLPKFIWTNGQSEAEYLKYLCQQGWKQKNRPHWDSVYKDRLQKELEVFHQANLEGYFLIVQDYVNYAKNQGWLVGPGRGSAAGCLVSYLLGITNIDPLSYGLVFERFYNAGRNTKDRVSYPDIDVDFPVSKRNQVIDYIRNKYGHDKVCQIATYGRMQGRGALKEVFRVREVDFNTSNKITQNIPQESSISDQLEDANETSIIRWVLQNDPKLVKDYCILESDGTLSGDYANEFGQAIRLEGTYRTQGKHAAGVIIAAEKLSDVCPMIRDKNSSEKISSMDGPAMEEMGHLKCDILGVNLLDKLMAANNLLMYGRINP